MKWRGIALQVRKGVKRGVNGVRKVVVGWRGSAPKVAIVSCNQWKGKVYDDLLLEGEFLKRGMKAEIVSWQDAAVRWGDFGVAVVGSMWGYQDFLEEFGEWLSKVERETKLVNPVAVIRENYDKARQFRGLKREGVPVIETRVVEIGGIEKFEFPKEEFVVKPAVSGGGEGTFLIKDRGDLERAWGELKRLNETKELLVQPFVAEIKKGELGVVVIGGEVMNVVRRFPGVIEGGYKVGVVGREEVSSKVWELVRKVVELPEYREAVYLRVDMVERKDGPVVMEVEALEPQLYYYLLRGEEREKALEKMVVAVGDKAGLGD